MGKSKKQTTEAPAPTNIVSAALKKGKRGLEEDVLVKSLKKQKKDPAVKKMKHLSSSDSSESEEEKPFGSKLLPTAKTLASKKGRKESRTSSDVEAQPTKLGLVKVKSHGSSDDSDSEEVVKNKQPAKSLPGKPSAQVLRKQESSSDESSSESDDEEPAEKGPKAGGAASRDKPVPAAIKSGEKATEQESSSEDDDSDSDEEPAQPVVKTSSKAKSQPAKGAIVNNGKKVVEPKSSSEDSSDSDEEETQKPFLNAMSSSSEDSSDSDEEVTQKPFLNAMSSSSEDSLDRGEEPAQPMGKIVSKAKSQPAKGAIANNGKKAVKPVSSSEEDSDSDDKPVKKPAASTAKIQPAKGSGVKNAKGATQQNSSSQDSSESDDSSDDEPVKPSIAPSSKPGGAAASSKAKPALAEQDSSSEDDSSDDSDVEQVKPVPVKPSVLKSKKQETSSDESSDSDDEEIIWSIRHESSDESDSDEQPQKKKTKIEPAKPVVNGTAESSDESEEDDENEDEEESEEDEDDETKKVITKQARTPAQGSAGGSKTVFVKNLAWTVDEASVQEFFKDAGEVQEVRLAMNSEGQFRGFGHVEFTSEEAAKKACKKTGEYLAGREIFVDLARERVFSPSSEGRRDFQTARGGGFSGGGSQRFSSDATAYVRGFDKFQDEDSIRRSLTELFGECGVQKIRIPTDRETGNIKGFAYIDFEDKQALSRAIEYNGSDLSGRSLIVEEAGGAPAPGSGSGRGRGGDFGGRGGRGGRGRGDFGERGRGGRGRGRQGFGMAKEKVSLSGIGKKTTFGED